MSSRFSEGEGETLSVFKDIFYLPLFSLLVFAVKLPGREARAKEPFFQSMEQIVDEVINVLLPVLKEKPFALFGHRYK